MDGVPTTFEYSSKFYKKLSRARAKLSKEGFQFSDSPTLYVVISNGGIANGVRRIDLEKLLTDFGNLVMPPQKSYAIAHFANVKNAELMMRNFQGRLLRLPENLASSSPVLYLHYVESSNSEKSEIYHPGWGEVPGLILLDDFISEREEEELISFLDAENPVQSNFSLNNDLKHRKVWHYGYEFRYKYSDVDRDKPLENGIPEILETVILKMIDTGHIGEKPNQVTVNNYEPGQGIPPHIDNPKAFGDVLASLSLSSQTVMDFRKINGAVHNQVLLKPRSLIIFTGESRYDWTHGICPRKVDVVPAEGVGSEGENLTPVNRGTRLSITFRRVRDDYKGPNDGQNESIPEVRRPADENGAEMLESQHVHEVYNEIASHFTSTRDKPWPRVVEFINSLKAHSIVLDVGCGSGRYLGVRSDVNMIGCDRSENLINICKEKQFEVFTCDGLNLSLRNEIFDACICIAVIHHYSTEERRKNAIEQLLHMVVRGGKILISVWALEQEYKRIKSKYLKRISSESETGTPSTERPSANKESNFDSNSFSTSNLTEASTYDAKDPASKCPMNEKVENYLPVHKNRTPFQQQDVLVPWHKKEMLGPQAKIAQSFETSTECSVKSMESRKTFHRYYHVFKRGELEELCSCFKNVKIVQSYYDEGNWCVIIEKL